MPLDRRSFLAIASSAGLASTLFPGALYALASQAESQPQPGPQGHPKPKPTPITQEMIDQAAALAGVTITPDQAKMMLDGLNEQRQAYAQIRKLHLPNSVAPAYVFDPLPPGVSVDTKRAPPHRHAKPTAKSPRANIAARSTACPGEPRTCSPLRVIPPPGEPVASSIRSSTRTPLWSSASTPPEPSSSPNSTSAHSPWATGGSEAAPATPGTR